MSLAEEMKQEPKVFLSHNSDDKDSARKIAAALTRAGCQIWLDEAEIGPGDSLIEKISSGIVDAEYLFVLLSKSSVRSEWVKREMNIALTREIGGRYIKVVPIKLDDCDVPVFLSDKRYLDFRNERDCLQELTVWLKLDDVTRGLFGGIRRASATHRFVRDILCRDLANRNTDRDAFIVFHFGLEDFRTFVKRAAYFNARISGVEGFTDEGIVNFGTAKLPNGKGSIEEYPVFWVWESGHFPEERRDGLLWCLDVASYINSNYNVPNDFTLTPSIRIDTQVLIDFGYVSNDMEFEED